MIYQLALIFIVFLYKKVIHTCDAIFVQTNFKKMALIHTIFKSYPTYPHADVDKWDLLTGFFTK